MSPEVLIETKEKTEAELVAERVFGYMVEDLAQPQLEFFEDENTIPSMRRDEAERLQREHPDKIIVHSKDVKNYRYIAAFLGGGFHMSQYDDVTYTQNEDAGQVARAPMFPSAVVKTVPKKSIDLHNKMRDELSEEVFHFHVPSTDYHFSSGLYVTSEEDLKQIFAFDYENLQACKSLDIDLLYEKEMEV